MKTITIEYKDIKLHIEYESEAPEPSTNYEGAFYITEVCIDDVNIYDILGEDGLRELEDFTYNYIQEERKNY